MLLRELLSVIRDCLLYIRTNKIICDQMNGAEIV